MTSSIKRVQLDLGEKSLSRLQSLKTVTEATSYAEVVKNALRLYEAVVMEAQDGGTFVVRTPAGDKEFLVF